MDPAPTYSRERTLRAAKCLGAHSHQQPARVASTCMVPIVPSVATRRLKPNPWAEAVVPDAHQLADVQTAVLERMDSF
jgi:hypothetical protein